MYSDATARVLRCAPLFRVWDSVRRGFGFADLRPNDGSIVEAWTGRFDKEGRPVYVHDIISVHHDWKLGWVRALVEKPMGASDFTGTVTGPEGVFHIAACQFADAYVEGNLHQHPHRLLPAVAQFPEAELSPQSWWWNAETRLPGYSSKGGVRRDHGTRIWNLSPSEAPESTPRTDGHPSRHAASVRLGVPQGTRVTRRAACV